MSRKLTKPSLMTIALAVMSVAAGTGCAKKDAAAVSSEETNDLSSSLTGMSQLPSVSEMAKANTDTAVAPAAKTSAAKLSIEQLDQLLKVTGNAPRITDLGIANVDTYFFNGLIAKINDPAWDSGSQESKQADANAFWGQLDNGPSGQGGCSMVANLAQSFGRMLQGATSTCYMKGIPKASAGVTISSGRADDVFAQTAKDKLVKVAISNMLQGGGQSQETANMNVFIKVSGSDSVGSGIYQAKLYMCPQPDAAPDEEETLTVDKRKGLFTDISFHNKEESGYSKITAYLKNASGGINFDLSKDRSALSFYRGSWGDFKSDVTLTSKNTIATKSYSSSTWGTDRNYSVSRFKGDSLKNLTFLEGGFNGINTCATCDNGGSNEHAYAGGIEFHDTFYAGVSSSALATEAAAEVIGSDAFFSDLDVPSTDLSANDCSATADLTVTADFSVDALLDVQTKCEGEKEILGQSLWQMCDSSQNADLQSAMNKIFQMYQHP